MQVSIDAELFPVKKIPMLKIWFKPNCSTCQTALSFIKDNGEEDIEIFEYMKEHPRPEDLREILSLLNMKAEDLLRKNEAYFKENLSDKTLSNEEWIHVMCEHPELIERPVVVKDGKAIVGRPAERVFDIF